MPKYRIGYGYGFHGTESEEIIEADHIDEAEAIAKDLAFERVEYWAEPYVETGDE